MTFTNNGCPAQISDNDKFHHPCLLFAWASNNIYCTKFRGRPPTIQNDDFCFDKGNMSLVVEHFLTKSDDQVLVFSVNGVVSPILLAATRCRAFIICQLLAGSECDICQQLLSGTDTTH